MWEEKRRTKERKEKTAKVVVRRKHSRRGATDSWLGSQDGSTGEVCSQVVVVRIGKSFCLDGTCTRISEAASFSGLYQRGGRHCVLVGW